jgi:hypothetical protein
VETDAIWEDEFHKELNYLGDPHNLLGWIMSLRDIEGTICLRFIDPVGNAFFNQLQIPVLIEELEALHDKVTEQRPLS